MKYIIFIIATISIFAIVGDKIVDSIENTIDRAEVGECLKLQQQALDYPTFWITENEKAQCEYHSIEIGKPLEYL